MGQAARQEVEAFGWKAATRKIREQQYSRAIRLGQTRHRCAHPLHQLAGLAVLALLCVTAGLLLSVTLPTAWLLALPALLVSRCGRRCSWWLAARWSHACIASMMQLHWSACTRLCTAWQGCCCIPRTGFTTPRC